VADIVDEANDRAQAELDAAIAAARGIPAGRREDVKQSADCCVECGDLIPSERQIAVPGCDLCVDCASELELRSRIGWGV